MEIIDALILGLIQGLTEFLPVSSSGHLVVGKKMLGYSASTGMLFEVVLHVGTLVAVMWFYRDSLRSYVHGLHRLVVPASPEQSFRERWAAPSVQEMLWIVVAMIPTGLIGIAFRSSFKKAGDSVSIVALMFGVTGLLLLVSSRGGKERLTVADMGWWRALLIGLAQGLAITPGISRSGTTIACALLLGLRREGAARFSFLLSIPAILGAMLLEIVKHDAEKITWAPLFLGGLCAAVVGYLALVLLVRLVLRGRLHWFTVYLWGLSAFLLYRYGWPA